MNRIFTGVPSLSPHAEGERKKKEEKEGAFPWHRAESRTEGGLCVGDRSSTNLPSDRRLVQEERKEGVIVFAGGEMPLLPSFRVV